LLEIVQPNLLLFNILSGGLYSNSKGQLVQASELSKSSLGMEPDQIGCSSISSAKKPPSVIQEIFHSRLKSTTNPARKME